MESIKISKIIATGLGSGLSPVAPGTTGSAAALLAWCLLPPEFSTTWILSGVFFIGLAASHLELKDNPGITDPGHIVIDEWAGILLPLLITRHGDYLSTILSFFLFRLFDVWKPYPVSRAEDLPGAFGVMLDDIFAGGYALAFLFAIQKVFHFG